MKTISIILCILICGYVTCSGQSPVKIDPVIEGGKLIVELVKAFSNKKEEMKDTGCKGKYADLCIENESTNSLTVYLDHRATAEKREVVVLPKGKECCLQARVGVWTYDLRVTGTIQSTRKGDILIEGCNNLVMNIK